MITRTISLESCDKTFIVPEKYVDGVHTTPLMSGDKFPIKFKVILTGQTFLAHGFRNGLILYTTTYGNNGMYFNGYGTYGGELGKDFIWI